MLQPKEENNGSRILVFWCLWEGLEEEIEKGREIDMGKSHVF